MSRDALTTRLGACAIGLNDDELAVLVVVAERLASGRAPYGPLVLATDRRNFRAEAAEEGMDAALYLAMHAVRAAKETP
jgi:hypothetical protein